MTWNPVPVEDLEADPADVRRLAEQLRALGARLLECSAAFRSGVELPAEAFDGLASDRFRSACAAQREVAVSTSLDLTALAGAADELARDLDDGRLALKQIRGVAHGGGLEVGGAAVWPPHPTERREDTPARQAAWAAYDRCWALRDTLEARRDAAGLTWRSALVVRPVEVVDPPSSTPADPVGPAGPVDPVAPVVPRMTAPDQGREPGREQGDGPTGVTSILGRVDREPGAAPATWVEGARDADGLWVAGHWADEGPRPAQRPPSIA